VSRQAYRGASPRESQTNDTWLNRDRTDNDSVFRAGQGEFSLCINQSKCHPGLAANWPRLGTNIGAWLSSRAGDLCWRLHRQPYHCMAPATSFSIATGNSLEAFLGAFILNNWLAGPSAFESPLGESRNSHWWWREWPLQLVPPSVSCRWLQLVSLNRVPFRQFGQPGGLAIWLAR